VSRSIVALSTALTLFVATFGCAGKNDEREGKAPATLVWGTQIEPGHLNPLVSTSGMATDLEQLLFLQLNEFGPPPDFDLVPALATRWELSDDGKVLTYYLREDVTWHDGRPTTARDVKYTYEMMVHPNVPYPSRQKLRLVTECEVVNDWTVRFHFSEPSWEPVFDTQFFVVPEHVLSSVAPTDMLTSDFSRAPIGNGPWKFKEWTRGQQIVFEANDASAVARPHFDRLVLRVIPEATTLLTELKTGTVDVYHRLPSRNFREIEADAAFEMHRVPDRTYVYLGWNHREPKYQDVRVRRALTMAVDRWSILEAFRDGFGTVIAAPIYEQHPMFNPNVEPYPYDPAESARLLDEAGWSARDADGFRTKDGKRFQIKLTLISGNEISEEMGTMVQAEYRKLGIDVTTEFFEWTVFIQKVNGKEFDATILARSVDLIFDPEEVFHSRAIDGKFNDVSFGDARVDSLIDLAKSTFDHEERKRIWWEFQEAMHDVEGITLLYTSETTYPVRRAKVAKSMADVRGGLYQITDWVPAGGGAE